MIPKIIWQTHKESYNKLPKYMTDCSDTWKKFNPNFEYKYLNESEVDDFIVDNFGKEWLTLLNSYPIKIIKIDTWKYMVLYTHGGVYADMDYICNSPIDSWLDEEKNMIIFKDDNFPEFSQSVFASAPNNSILKNIIDSIKHDLINADYTQKELVAKLTGYKQFTLGIKNSLSLDKKTQKFNNYVDFNNLNSVKEMKIYTPYFEDWDRYNPKNKLFYTVNGRINWKNNYTNWIEEQQKFQTKKEVGHE
jgi:mannosyltransferase OCH1-like enzyme